MSRKICSAVIAASVFIFLVSFNGCDKDLIVPVSTVKNITGKVYGIFGYPQKDLIVRIGNNTAKTSIDGSFYFANVEIPYDLYLKDSAHNKGYVYQGLTSDDISIPIVPSDITSPANIQINYPPGIFQSAGKLIFTDEDYINAYGDAGANGGSILLYVTPRTSIQGKVIVLLYTKSDSNITSYDRFGMKDSVTVTGGGNVSVNFSDTELSYNPNEKTLSYNLIPISGYSVVLRMLYLHFGTRQTLLYASSVEFERFNNNTLSIIVPEQLPISFTPLIRAVAQDNNSRIISDKFFISGNSGNLQMHSPPQLIYPPNNFQNVDTNTIFSYDKYITEPGIISIVFRESLSNTTYQILTAYDNVTLQGLSSFGFDSLNNKTFNWFCEKLGEYQSVDEYLSPALNVKKQFHSNTVSRSFTTKP